MEAIQLFNREGKAVGEVQVPKELEGPVNEPVLWQAVRSYLSNQRRGEVRGGGKKPWRQTHTGRARAGTIRSPLWRKGGIVFGPHPRDYRTPLPARVQRLALVNSLRAKLETQSVAMVEGLDGLEPKTKALAGFLRRLQAEERTLLVVDRPTEVLARISRNLPGLGLRRACDLSCYDLLSSGKVIVTAEAWKELEKRAQVTG
jgi:large subunit ribosomal protein L4